MSGRRFHPWAVDRGRCLTLPDFTSAKEQEGSATSCLVLPKVCVRCRWHREVVCSNFALPRSLASGFWQPWAGTALREPAEHLVIHSTGHRGRGASGASTPGVFGVSRIQCNCSSSPKTCLKPGWRQTKVCFTARIQVALVWLEVQRRLKKTRSFPFYFLLQNVQLRRKWNSSGTLSLSLEHFVIIWKRKFT